MAIEVGQMVVKSTLTLPEEKSTGGSSEGGCSESDDLRRRAEMRREFEDQLRRMIGDTWYGRQER